MHRKNHFKNKTIVIVVHIYAIGSAFKLDEYMRKRAKRVIFIGHPFSYVKDRRSILQVYEKGELVTEKRFASLTAPEVIFYMKDILLTIWWVFQYAPRNVDYYIGVDNLNAFSGYILR